VRAAHLRAASRDVSEVGFQPVPRSD